MKKPFFKQLASSLAAFLVFSTASFSQLNDVDFLRAAQQDAVKYIGAYIAPWAKAFGAGLNGSWYNTAKPHKFGGFDITFGANVGMVPSSAETFDLSSLGLSSANYSVTSGSVPTIAGPKGSGIPITYSVAGHPLTTFNAPEGTGWKFVPVPTLQVGIGLPMGTELKVRYIPTLPIKDSKVGLWGVGLMHSIMQYIPGNKLLPVDVSVFAGYTVLNGNVPLQVLPDGASSITLPLDNQMFTAKIDALNVCAVASFNIPVLTIYGGLGYSKTNTTFKLSGNFPTPTWSGTAVEYTNAGVKTGESFPGIEIKDFSGLRANIGLRVKLAVVTIHADYTRAQYNVFSTGLGISFR